MCTSTHILLCCPAKDIIAHISILSLDAIVEITKYNYLDHVFIHTPYLTGMYHMYRTCYPVSQTIC